LTGEEVINMLKNKMFVFASIFVALVATFVAFSPDSVVWLNEPEVPQEFQK
jgi:cyclic lactone autoinducer peptide